jgi:hypothetical protein
MDLMFREKQCQPHKNEGANNSRKTFGFMFKESRWTIVFAEVRLWLLQKLKNSVN